VYVCVEGGSLHGEGVLFREHQTPGVRDIPSNQRRVCSDEVHKHTLELISIHSHSICTARRLKRGNGDLMHCSVCIEELMHFADDRHEADLPEWVVCSGI
jgi:hypothetical protein